MLPQLDSIGHWLDIRNNSPTILKALFDESSIVSNPVVPTSDGLSLVSYDGRELTVGGELNKLAANIAMGRNFAGIHWRSNKFQRFAFINSLSIFASCGPVWK